MSQQHDSPFLVVPIRGCGYGMRARRNIRRGEVVISESPIAVLGAEALHLVLRSDPMLQACVQQARSAQSQWRDSQEWPAQARATDVVIQRFAERVFVGLGPDQQRRWMALVDSFSQPPDKSPGNVVRSNAFTDTSTGDNMLFELLSRANHSCAPSMSRVFRGHGVVVHTTRDVGGGEELTISYLSEMDLQRPAEERRQLLRSRFNFFCECDRCGPLRVPDINGGATSREPVALLDGTGASPADATTALVGAQAALRRHLQVAWLS
jgi:hypothetical protein